MLTVLRHKQRKLTPRLLAVMGLVWLNMVLNPCAMALEIVDDHDCPHCPEVEHCDEQLTGSCRFIDSIDSDGRTHQTRAPDFSDYSFSLPAEVTTAPVVTVVCATVVDIVRITGPPGPPLYIKNCAYLI